MMLRSTFALMPVSIAFTPLNIGLAKQRNQFSYLSVKLKLITSWHDICLYIVAHKKVSVTQGNSTSNTDIEARS